MPNWKKLLYSGSNGSLNTLNISTALTASGLNYPSTDGTSGQAIVTDGSGNLSFTTITSGTTTDTGSLLTTASAAGSTITFEKGDGSTFDVVVSSEVTPANALVTASLAGSVLTFEKGDTSTFDIILPPGGYSGSNATAHLNQTVAAETWSFAHNLDDRYPVFTVFDSNGDIIVPNRVETVDTNNANIYFTTPRTGTVTAVIASSISQISSVTYNFTNETTVAVTHSLDTRNIHVSVYDENYALVIPESVTLDTLDTVVVTFPTAKSGTVVVAKGGHILSGSAVLAETASYIASSNVDGPLGMDSVLSASYAVTSSYIESGNVYGPLGFNSVLSSSYALTSSYNVNPTVSGSISGADWIDFSTGIGDTVPYTEGRLFYDDQSGALAFYNDEAEITLQIGQEFYKRVYNASGQRIDNGTPVRISGSQGDMPLIWPAYSQDVYSGSYNARQNKFIGIATHHIEDNSVGYVTEKGIVRGINTTNFPAGSQLYLQTGSNNIGVAAYRTDPPPFPYDVTQVGIVVRSHSNGFVEVVGVRPITSDNISGVINITTQVINDESTTIAKGTPVHAVSAGTGPVPRVKIAKANDPTLMPATFVTTETIPSGSQGQALAIGYIYDVDTSAFNVGDIAYVAPNGGYTNQKPTGSNELVQNLGVVLKSHPTEGSGFMYGAGRSNDVPNLAGGKIWVGNEQGHFTTSSIITLDETAGELQVTGSATVTGNLTVQGTVTAQEFHTEFVSASIVYRSGSTKFGDSQDDNHNFTGSINVTGSVTATSFSGIFEGAISSSAQIASDISGSFTLLSSSLENRIVLNEATGSDHESRLSTLESKSLISSSAQIATEISGALGTVSASLSGRISSLESFSSSLDATFATDADLNLVSASVDALNAATSSYALAANISGSITSISSSIASDIADIIDGTTTVTSASYALTASYALNVPVTASYAITASYIDPTFISASAAAAGFGAGGGGGTGDGFPYAGDAVITGSLFVSGGYISGSFKGDGSQLTGIDVGSVTTVSQTFTSQTQVVVSHNFNSKDINVAVYNSSDEYIIPDTITLTDNNTVTVDFAIATSGRIVVTKGGHIVTALGLTSKAGSVATSSFSATGSSFYYDVAFESSFNSSNYSVTLQAHSQFSVPDSFPGHAWVDSDKTAAGFRIVVPAFDTTTDEIHWTAIAHGESDVTASHAATSTTASYALSALTASYALNAGAGAGFPYSGSAIITGSLIVSQSFIDFTQATVISGSIFSGSFVGDGTGLTGLGYGDTKKLNQAVAATTWSFSHNMNEQYPTVTVYNNSNEVIQPTKIEGVDNQTLKLYFGVPTAGTAVAVVGGVATTQEAGFNRVLTQTSTATTWSFAHNLGQKYPQITVYDVNDELIIPGKVEAVDQNNAVLYFDTAQAGTVAATVGGTAMTASYSDTLIVTDTLLSSQKNTDVDTGTETVATVSTSLYDGAFFDYVIKDGTNYRAGTVMAVWDGTSVQFNDNSTADIGNTSGVTLAVDISGTDARLRATVSSDNWNIKAFVRAL